MVYKVKEKKLDKVLPQEIEYDVYLQVVSLPKCARCNDLKSNIDIAKAKLLSEFNINIIVEFLDANDDNVLSWAKDLGCSGLPATVIVDKNSRDVYKIISGFKSVESYVILIQNYVKLKNINPNDFIIIDKMSYDEKENTSRQSES